MIPRNTHVAGELCSRLGPAVRQQNNPHFRSADRAVSEGHPGLDIVSCQRRLPNVASFRGVF